MLESGSHVVEFRDGKKYLYLNGYFVGKTTGENISKYYKDLKNAYLKEHDVMKVYFATEDCSLENILSRHGKMIWERKEPRTISKEEALKKLEEVYGEEVKVEW